MKHLLKIIIAISACFYTSAAFCQNNLKIEIENLSLKAPETWSVERQTDPNGFTVKMNNGEIVDDYITVSCIKKTMNLEATLIDYASKKSTKKDYEYMLIEKVISQKFNRFNAKFLQYTNSPLRDYYRGGFYGFISDGYTYIIDFYSLDMPQYRNEITQILKSLKVLKPESRPNFFLVEKEFLPENVKLQKPQEEAIIEQQNGNLETDYQIDQADSQVSEEQAQATEPKKSFWQKITSIFKKKDKKEQPKEQ